MSKINSKQKKLLIKFWIIFWSIFFILFSIIIWVLIYENFIKAKPSLIISPEKIINYSWNLDKVSFDNLWIKFDLKNWWNFINHDRWFIVEYTDWSKLGFKMEKTETLSWFILEKSIKDYSWNGITYNLFNNKEIKWKYQEVLFKWRNSIIFDWKSIIRVLDNVSFDINKNPLSNFETLSWDYKKLETIYLEMYKEYFFKKNFFPNDDTWKYNEEEIIRKNWISDVKEEKNLLNFTMYSSILNKQETYKLNNDILNDVINKYLTKYDYNLNEEEINKYKKNIESDANWIFNEIKIFKIFYFNKHIYQFSFLWTKWEISLWDLEKSNTENTFIKNIEITFPESRIIKWSKINYYNINFLLPDIFKIKWELTEENITLIPFIPNYENGKISINKKTVEDTEFIIKDFINNEVNNYIWQDFINKNKYIESSKLIKKEEWKLWWFEHVYKLVFEVKLVNWNYINVIDYYLFNNQNKIYYVIEYIYSDYEIITLPSFNAFINSIKRINN